VGRFVLNPQLVVPGSIEPLTTSGRLALADRIDPGSATVYHVGSPIELEVPVSDLWPRAAGAAGVRLVATLYDLIPRLFADRYLMDPLVRRRYETRLRLVRRADRILAISRTTANDAVNELGIDPSRITVVGTGVSPHFRPAADRDAPLAAVRAALPQVEPGFLLYTGGIDPRKNISGLLSAYALLEHELRAAHQLVVVCRVTDDERLALDAEVAELGIAERVLFTGFVSDDLLLALYQSTMLFVFPSLYEGFGLPVAEAIAADAPVAGSNIEALDELGIDPAARFDPSKPPAIAETIRGILRSDDFRAHLRDTKLPAWASWSSVADRMAMVYEEVAAPGRRLRPRRSRRPRIAFVTPLPPQRSGVADDSYRLLEALTELVDIDAVADGPEPGGDAPPGIRVLSMRNFHAGDAMAGGYDQVFYCLGNSEFHAGALELLRGRHGVVIAHDVRLTGLYGWVAANRQQLLPEGFRGALETMYGDLPPEIGATGALDFWEANRTGLLMAREAIARSSAFLVHSAHASQLARLEAPAGHEHKVAVLPFRYPAPASTVTDSGQPLVGSFGLVSPAKQPDRLLEAWPLVVKVLPDAKLAIVGSDAGSGEGRRLAARAAELGIGGSFVLTGDVDEPTFHAWIDQAVLAVQLRAGSNGESSAVVAQALAAGVPAIVTAIGAARELPDDVVVKVERDVTPARLAEEIISLLRSPQRRQAMGCAGIEFARRNSYENAAHLLVARYVPALRQAA
jgi:glycosyltransferase involved in cell wall biosynthesis